MIVNNQVASHDFDETNFASRSIGDCIKIYTPLAYFKDLCMVATVGQQAQSTLSKTVKAIATGFNLPPLSALKMHDVNVVEK